MNGRPPARDAQPLTHEGQSLRFREATHFEIEGASIPEDAHWTAGGRRFSLTEYNQAHTAYKSAREIDEHATTEITALLQQIEARAVTAAKVAPPPLAQETAAR